MDGFGATYYLPTYKVHTLPEELLIHQSSLNHHVDKAARDDDDDDDEEIDDDDVARPTRLSQRKIFFSVSRFSCRTTLPPPSIP